MRLLFACLGWNACAGFLFSRNVLRRPVTYGEEERLETVNRSKRIDLAAAPSGFGSRTGRADRGEGLSSPAPAMQSAGSALLPFTVGRCWLEAPTGRCGKARRYAPGNFSPDCRTPNRRSPSLLCQQSSTEKTTGHPQKSWGIVPIPRSKASTPGCP